MKKLIIVLVLLLAATALFAQSIKIGAFPAAKWLDDRYDAVWEFTANNIRILSSTDGSVLWDFAGKTINDFKVTVDNSGEPSISFSCTEAERSYSFKPRVNGDLTMVIERPGMEKNTKVIKKQ